MVNALTEALESEVETEPKIPEQNEDTFVSELIGPGKKYGEGPDAVKKLAKSYYHADLHIKELTEELHEERKKRLDDQKTLQEVVAELRKSPNTPVDAPSNQNDEAARPAEVSEETVLKAVDKAMDSREALKVARENTDAALVMLTTHYGTKKKALEAVANVINNDERMRKTINELAAINPTAAFRMVTGEQAKPQDKVNAPGTESGLSPATVLVNAPHGLKWSDCRKLRKEKPLEYNSQAFRAKIAEAVVAYQKAGLDFYNT